MTQLSAKEVYEEIDAFNYPDAANVYIALKKEDGTITYGKVVDTLRAENIHAGAPDEYVGKLVLIATPTDEVKLVD